MSTDDNPGKQDKAHDSHGSVYILITECLQNDFFLADDNRLCLPRDVVANMLIGTADDHAGDAVYDKNDVQGRRQFKTNGNSDPLKKGPLYRFFDVVTKERDSELYMINIRDWHNPSPEYDAERRTYGSHCKAGSWGAKGIDGFEKFLEPWELIKDKEAKE